VPVDPVLLLLLREKLSGTLMTSSHSLAWTRAVARWRAFGLVALASAITACAAVFLFRAPDLLAGRPFRTSSATPEFNPKTHAYGGGHLPIFFHTKEEPSPWVEFDLGKPTVLRRVVTVNRRDGAEDRAVPLVIEVSDDTKEWRAVAREAKRFTSWEARFDATTARYLRLRTDRKSLLHLQSVEAYAR
jgi:F5/8 type C domain